METGRMTEPELELDHEPEPFGPQAEGEGSAGGGGAQPAPPSPRARLLPWAATLVVGALFFALCLAQSFTQSWNADTASTSLQGWDLVHGHLLLHGWWSGDVNFYTLDTPLYGLCLLVLGFGSTALHVGGALLYTLVFLAAAWLAKGHEHGARAWLRVALTALLMTAPLFGGALLSTLVLVPDHCGTVIFALLSFTLVSRFVGRRWAPWALLLVLSLGQLGDATVRYVTVPALLIVWVLDTLLERRLRTPRHWLALATVVSVPLSMAVRTVMKDHGAYYLTKAHNQVAPSSVWASHIKGTWLSLLSLFGVQSSGFPGDGALEIATSIIGGLALLLGAGSLFYTAARWTKVDVADRLLVAAVVVYLGAYTFSTVGQAGGGGGYEFVGTLVMLAVLGARTIARLRVPRLNLSESAKPRAVLAGTTAAALGATACLLAGTALFRPVLTSPDQPLAAWLEQHHLTYGLSGYWNAGPVDIYSGDKVQVRQMILVPGGFVPYAWYAKEQWYQPGQHDANFIVTDNVADKTPALTVAAAESCFGKPSAVYQVDGFSVLVYPYNLLTKGVPPVLDAGM